MTPSPFAHTSYLLRRKVLKLFGGAFHIYAPDGSLAFYSQQKAFRLKEDIRVYADESMSRELLVIRARGIIDLGMTYDVIDPAASAPVGSVRRKGLKSILKDEWVLMDAQGREIGLITEDNAALALLRRTILGWMCPQTYDGTIGGHPVCHFHRNFNPFVSKVTLDFGADTAGRLDRRLGIAAAILLLAIEDKQN
ncbi:MAG: hypothetical protein FGM37_02510 [Phycisphaerales bacterium]|nr:hypothetical protein [Phycisphaerales bacterium]